MMTPRNGFRLALIFLAACSSPGPQPPPDPASAERVAKVRAGEFPDVRGIDDPALADAVAQSVRETQRWKSEEDRKKALVYLTSHARREHLDALLLVVEREDGVPAIGAIQAARGLLGPAHLPRVERLLESDDRGRRLRGLILLRLAAVEGSAAVIERHAAALLGPAGPEIAGAALRAIRDLGARQATEAVVAYYASAEDPLALQTLGRLWEQPMGSRDESKGRLLALLAAHKVTMSAAATPESADAMLRIMTGAEIEKFLADHAADRFVSALQIARAAGTEGFDAAKCRRIHQALLANKDPNVVAVILWTSPHELPTPVVADLLKDPRTARAKGIPEARICDHAAARLEAQVEKKPMEIPPAAQRDARVAKWRGWAERKQ